MRGRKPINIENKVNVGFTLDAEVVRAIDRMRQRENKSSYVNYLLRDVLGLENEQGATA